MSDDLIPSDWMRPIEQIVLPVLESKIRVLGFTSANHGAGVTSVTTAAALALAKSGIKVVVLDFTQPVANAADGSQWLPGEGGAQARITPAPGGYDLLAAIATEDTRYLFNSGKRLRRTLFEDLSEYAAVLVDLPPLLAARSDTINPVTAALACDQVLLVVANCRTSRDTARQAVELAKSSGIKLTGAIFNNCGAPTVGRDIARSARRYLAFAPALAKFIERKALGSSLLN